jgi:hypothetical protein
MLEIVCLDGKKVNFRQTIQPKSVAQLLKGLHFASNEAHVWKVMKQKTHLHSVVAAVKNRIILELEGDN